jgi:tetratricopeptide (TPR) repeat protein
VSRRDDRAEWNDLSAADLSLLDEWLEIKDKRIRHRGWFGDGRSKQPVGLVVVDDAETGRSRLVLKICASKEGVTQLGRAWTLSASDFRNRHLLEQLEVCRLDGRYAVFCRVTRGDFVNYGSLHERLDDRNFPEICRQVVASVVFEWNKGKIASTPLSPTAAQLLHGLIGKRLEAVNDWSRRIGVDVGGAVSMIRRPDWDKPLRNPFVLLAREPSGRLIEDLLAGYAHGDLSGRNIRVPVSGNGTLDDYVLIDADHFESETTLARDPMHLLVALALDWIDHHGLGPQQSRDLIRVIVEPNWTSAPASTEAFRAVSVAIWEASAELASHHDLRDVWIEQCLLCLVGVALVHIGRDRTAGPGPLREWCFDLAAVAADAYLQMAELRDRRSPRRVMVPRADQGLQRETRSASVVADGTGMLDHEQERALLRALVAEGQRGVVVVHGPEGVGKTMLVQTVLADVRPDPSIGPGLRVCEREVLPNIRFDVKALIDDISGGTEPAAAIRFGESSLMRLTATLDTVRDKQVLIIIEAAEHLLHPDTCELMDLDLDEAFETLTTNRQHRVCIALVTRSTPRSPLGGSWPTAIPPISLSKLPYPHFLEFLARLDRGNSGLSRLDEATLQDLYRRLEGNPRRVELLYAVLELTDNGGPEALARKIDDKPSTAIVQSLTAMLIYGLSEIRREALAALAAYGIPVGSEEVMALVGTNRTLDQVEGALHALAGRHLARRTNDGHYFVPVDDFEWMLDGAFRDRLSPEKHRSAFLRRAADELSRLRISEPGELNDLRFHFAELNALLRAGRQRLAYPLMHEIDRVLSQWNYSDLLLSQRRAVVGRLNSRRYEMANDNELGDLYAARGDFDRARATYERARRTAAALRDKKSQAKIAVNTATMHWQFNDAHEAFARYEEARVGALRVHDLEVLVGALEGIADCHRRWGAYDQALRSASEAQAVASADDYPDDSTAQDFASAHIVNISLKMARWYGELDRLEDAHLCIRRAAAGEVMRRDEWLLASCYDGRADLALFEGNPRAAMAHATTAIEHALRLHDPITLLQARTTMCLAHLAAGNPLAAAAREIERAARYRRQGRSLITLALQALVARSEGRTRDAARRFDELLEEARARIDRDSRDFGAWDFVGFAQCGKALDGGSLDRAIEAFQVARGIASSTPGLAARLHGLIRKLDETGSRRGGLLPILKLLDEATRPTDR